MRPYAFVYILTNKSRTTLYVSVTADLPATLWKHLMKRSPASYIARHDLSVLVYYERFGMLTNAIKREKYIKGKSRKWKEELIRTKNPIWRDLTDDVCS